MAGHDGLRSALHNRFSPPLPETSRPHSPRSASRPPHAVTNPMQPSCGSCSRLGSSVTSRYGGSWEGWRETLKSDPGDPVRDMAKDNGESVRSTVREWARRTGRQFAQDNVLYCLTGSQARHLTSDTVSRQNCAPTTSDKGSAGVWHDFKRATKLPEIPLIRSRPFSTSEEEEPSLFTCGHRKFCADAFHDSTAILMDGDIRWVIRRGHRPMMTLETTVSAPENSSSVSRVTLGQRAEFSVRTTALCVMGGAKERPAAVDQVRHRTGNICVALPSGDQVRHHTGNICVSLSSVDQVRHYTGNICDGLSSGDKVGHRTGNICVSLSSGNQPSKNIEHMEQEEKTADVGEKEDESNQALV
ncbi:hypothetical protein Bbelb_208780 [Branchiostoma belcheri]|nr:hypothetical protein Bbelb_208780 [Branchiostoma belcheri]